MNEQINNVLTLINFGLFFVLFGIYFKDRLKSNVKGKLFKEAGEMVKEASIPASKKPLKNLADHNRERAAMYVEPQKDMTTVYDNRGNGMNCPTCQNKGINRELVNKVEKMGRNATGGKTIGVECACGFSGTMDL